MSILEINSRLSTIVAAAEADLRRLVLDAGKAIAHELGTAEVKVGLATINPSTGVVSVTGVAELIALAQEMTKSVGIAFAKPVDEVQAVVSEVEVAVENAEQKIQTWFSGEVANIEPPHVTEAEASPGTDA